MTSICIPALGAVVVELYTSEDRAGCPPAGRQPGELRSSSVQYRCASTSRSL